MKRLRKQQPKNNVFVLPKPVADHRLGKIRTELRVTIQVGERNFVSAGASLEIPVDTSEIDRYFSEIWKRVESEVGAEATKAVRGMAKMVGNTSG